MEGTRREHGKADGQAARGREGANRYPFWLWPNLLSLDAPAVAVLWQWLFAYAAGVVMPLAAHVLLGVAVWVIYAGDRLLDAARLEETLPATARHRFYRRHWKVFLAAVLAAGILCAGAVSHLLPEGLVARGVFLALVVACYFVSVELMRRYRRIVIPKEILCGIIFAIGTNLSPAFYLSNQDAGGFSSPVNFLLEGVLGIGEAATLPVFVFMGLCCLNCAVIAVWERGADAAQDPAALSHAGRALDVSFSRSFLLLFAVSIVMLIRERGDAEAAVYACVAASALGLLFLDRREALLSQSARRALADAVLLTPLAVLPFAG